MPPLRSAVGNRGIIRPTVPGCYVTKFAPHEALKLIAWRKLTCDERVVLHRVVVTRVWWPHFSVRERRVCWQHLSLPHGGARTVHQKSTYLTQSTLGWWQHSVCTTRRTTNVTFTRNYRGNVIECAPRKAKVWWQLFSEVTVQIGKLYYGPFIKSQPASCNRLEGFMQCTFDHVPSRILGERGIRGPPCG